MHINCFSCRFYPDDQYGTAAPISTRSRPVWYRKNKLIYNNLRYNYSIIIARPAADYVQRDALYYGESLYTSR